jgi:protein phosphatase
MIPAERSHLHVAARSHPGMSGKNNEDRYAVSALRLSQENPLPVVFAIVCDGIGGHRAGEVAAEMAVETISQQVAASDTATPVETLKQAIIHASENILVKAEDDPGQKGMGATCACCWVIDDHLYIASVGDSRIYLLRNRHIQQLTTDHTWVQEAMEAGLLTPEQATSHPNAHVIRRYLGSQKKVMPDIRLRLSPDESDAQAEKNQGLQLLPGDQILICSDGLTDLVNDEEIRDALETEKTEKALKDLIDLANRRGGHDNITMIALRVPTAIPATELTLPSARPWKVKLGCLTAGLVSLLGITLLIGAYLFWNYVITTPVPPNDNTPTQGIILSTPQETTTFEVTPSSPIDLATSTSLPTTAPTLTPWPVTPASP